MRLAQLTHCVTCRSGFIPSNKCGELTATLFLRLSDYRACDVDESLTEQAKIANASKQTNITLGR